jgi:hypothetical protein
VVVATSTGAENSVTTIMVWAADLVLAKNRSALGGRTPRSGHPPGPADRESDITVRTQTGAELLRLWAEPC